MSSFLNAYTIIENYIIIHPPSFTSASLGYLIMHVCVFPYNMQHLGASPTPAKYLSTETTLNVVSAYL